MQDFSYGCKRVVCGCRRSTRTGKQAKTPRGKAQQMGEQTYYETLDSKASASNVNHASAPTHTPLMTPAP